MPAGSILVADDDTAIRTVLNQALSRAGYEVRLTGNAATLWRWVSQGEGAEVGAHRLHEGGEPLARDVELGDHFTAPNAGAEAPVERAVVVLQVEVQLVRIGVVPLPGRCEIELGEHLEGTPLVGVCQFEQLVPVAL